MTLGKSTRLVVPLLAALVGGPLLGLSPGAPVFDARRRRPLVLQDVDGMHLGHVRARRAVGVPRAWVRDVRDVSGHDTPGLDEATRP